MSLLEWLPWIRERKTNELADELAAHLEMAEADRVARGESPREAAANARREFGNAGLVQEISRDEWGSGAMGAERLAQDVRFALRLLRKAPGFASVAILTIALGIGATTAIYSVIDATLLHPLPYPHAEALVRIEDDLVGLGARDVGMSTPEWRDLERSGVFESVSPFWFDNNNLTGLAHPQRVKLLIAAPTYFTVLGVKPQRGAGFDPLDRTPGFNEQAVISDGLWKSAFGGDPNILGRIVQLDSDSYRIVGVMPAGFHAPARIGDERATEVWPAFGFAGAPLSEASVQARSPLFEGAIARVKPGLTIAEAQSRIDALVQALRRQFPGDYPPQSDWRVRLVPLKDSVVGDVRQPLLFLFGAVALVLLIGCANVANLLLARASTRGREMAVRLALGGAPSRLMRQLLTESVVLSVVGGVIGVAILLATKGSFVRLVPESVPRLHAISINWGVLGFAFAASLAAGAVFGLAPALHVRGLDVIRVLKLEGRGSTSSKEQKRTRHLLVVAEFALSLVLMTAGGLLARSFWEMVNAPLGFNPRNVTMVRTRLPYPNEPGEDLYPDVAAEARFVREVIRRSRALPGVEGVAIGSGAAVPLDHPQQDQPVLRVRLEGDASHGEQPLFVTGSEVTPEYFHVLGMTLVRGRLLDEFDIDSSPPVAVINESMARTYWPNQDALGKRLKLSRRATAWTTIVGIVADARTESLEAASTPHLFASLYQQQGKHLAIFLRGRLETGAIARAERDEVQAVNSALPVFGAQTLDETISASLAIRRFSMKLIAMFAVTALFLAALGIYGVMSCMVSEHAHEFGLRIALGARPADVMSMVMRQAVRLVAVGAAVGLVGAVLVSRGMAGLLVGVRFTDPVSFGAATALLTLVALAGCYLPARRAIRVDPMVALHG
ncbi:MAG TPA: ABC transporter permease [Gemmatimonadaceae bacterium]|nr:ABC transporter permease [Gemmatimonadaceae bacterium]